MRWIVLLAVVLAVLVTSAPLWAQSLGAPMHASVLAMVNVVGDGVRASPEQYKMAALGAFLIGGSTRLRRRRRPEEADGGTP